MSYIVRMGILLYMSNGRQGKEDVMAQIKKAEKEHYVATLNITRAKFQKYDVPENHNEIRLFVIVRNEELRLPYFLKYYKKLGVDRFFIIDNGSTDSTLHIAHSCNHAHVIKMNEPYRNHWYWMETFLADYGTNHWCMVVDADELFCYPNAEYLPLRRLIAYLEKYEFTAVRSLLLDMYSDKPVEESIYRPNEDPLNCCAYFDRQFDRLTNYFYDRKNDEHFKMLAFYGGMRRRIFGKRSNTCITKFPLFKYLPSTYLLQGMHSINNARIADIEGVVFHTKFMSDFIPEAKEESIREQHINNAIEYKRYYNHIKKHNSLLIKNNRSIRYRNMAQLVNLGMIKSTPQFDSFR